MSRRLHVGSTELLGLFALGATGTAVALEYAHVWRRGRAPLPVEVDGVEVLAAGAEAAIETVEVAVEGYRSGSIRENALLNMLLSFSLTFGLVRASTHMIRARGSFGPLRNISLGGQHIHHFVPGIALAFSSGAAAILTRRRTWDPWLALPFGVGAALTLDETALLLELEDVYWTEEGLLSVQAALAAMALLGTGAIAARVLRRGELEVLGEGAEPAAG